MAANFTVVFSVRQRFGDNKQEGQFPTEQEAPFVGLAKDFDFTCPSVIRGQKAVLQFESLGVQDRNVVTVNGQQIFGGITSGPVEPELKPHFPIWKSHCLVVGANVLNEQNVLHIESVPNALGNHDDFIVDNAVVFFKAKDQVVTPT